MRSDPGHLTPDDWVKANELMESKYLSGKPQSYCQGHVQFAMLKGSIGYLRVNAFNSYAKGGYSEELRALEAALDARRRRFDQWRGPAMDVLRNRAAPIRVGTRDCLAALALST